MSAKSGARLKVANEVVSSEFGSSGRYHALAMLPDGSMLASRGHTIYHIQSQGGVHRYAGTLEPGSIDGDRLKESLFNRPTGIHSSEGAVFVVGSGEHKIRIIKDDMVSTFAGTGALGWRDGPKEESIFSFPEQMTEMNRVLFVTDTGNNRIRMIDKMTGFVSSIGSSRSISQDGDFLSCSFNAPKGICPSPDRTFLIVSDHFGHLLRRVDIGPVPTVTTVVGKQNLLPLTSQRDSDPDIFEIASSEESKEPIAHGLEPSKLHLKAPWGVTFTHDGDLVVCDLEGQSLLLLTLSGLAYDILSTASPTSCVVDPRSGSLVWLSRSAGLHTLPEFSSRSPERPPVDPRWLSLDGIDYSWILDSPGAQTISDAHFAHIPSSNLYHLHSCVLQCVGTDLDSMDKLSVCDFPVQVVEALIGSFYGKRPRLSQPHADDKFSPQFQLCATYARLSFLYALLELRDWCHWAERQFKAALILLSAPELVQLSVTLSNDSAGNNMHCLDMISQHWRVITTGDIALKESAISMLFSNIDTKLLAIFMGPPISSDTQSPQLESPASKPITEESSYSPPQPLEGQLQSPLATLSNTLLTFGSKLKFRKASKKDKAISRSSSKRNLKASGSETSSTQVQHFEDDLEDRFRSFSLQLSLQCPHQLTPPNVVLTVLQHSKLLEVHDWVLCKWSYCRKLLVSKATPPQSRKIMIESMPSSRSLSSSTSAPSSGTNPPPPSLQHSTPVTASSQQELHEVQTLEFPAGFPKPLLLFIVQSLYGVPLLVDDLSTQECSFFVENAAKYEFCTLLHEKSHPTEQAASPGFEDLMAYCKERLEGGGFPSRWARKKWMFWR